MHLYAVAEPGIILSLGAILTINAQIFIDLRFSDQDSTRSDSF
jgi:hypothetical protein